MQPAPHQARRSWQWKVALAFATVYLVWGSTYLAIRVGVAELPPALFAGARFLVAGVALGAYAYLVGQRVPRRFSEWRAIAIVGLMLLVAANGLVVWGEQWVASNQAALIVATAALWIAGLGTLGARGHALSRQTAIGLGLGFVGVAVLLLPGQGLVLDNLWGQLAILLAALSWASGSIYMKRRPIKTPPLMAAALQSLIAGAVLCLIGVIDGETSRWVWTPTAMASLLYLIVFGSCFAYAAYVWLLHEVSPAALGTYAYVNPAVAVVLGWWFLGESLGRFEFAGMLVILFGVLLVSTSRPRALTAPAQRS